jgi:hypothetical protein
MKILTKYELSSPTGYYSGSFLLFRLVLLYTSSYNWCRVWAISHPLSRICTLCAQSRDPGSDNMYRIFNVYGICVAEPPELFWLKCASHRCPAD